MILQKKLTEYGEIERYKAELVAHGFRHWPGIDFDKSSAPLVGIAVVRLTVAVLGRHMTINHLDVTTVFLESKVNEELYMTLLKGEALLEGRLKVSSRT